jgi:hypothetical protein
MKIIANPRTNNPMLNWFFVALSIIILPGKDMQPYRKKDLGIRSSGFTGPHAFREI